MTTNEKGAVVRPSPDSFSRVETTTSMQRDVMVVAFRCPLMFDQGSFVIGDCV